MYILALMISSETESFEVDTSIHAMHTFDKEAGKYELVGFLGFTDFEIVFQVISSRIQESGER